jgi:alpha-L-fucosidase
VDSDRKAAKMAIDPVMQRRDIGGRIHLTRRGLLGLGAAATAGVAASSLLGAAPAAARDDGSTDDGLFNPRQRWLRDSLGGIFLHWGLLTAPGYTDVAEWQADVTNGGWSAQYWVDQAKLLHGSYLVLTAFHSKLGYLRAWPSKIPGSATASRDFLGELITAANAEGLHVILYMTDDPQHHAETGFEYLDYQAYADYVGDPTVDIRTRDGFGRFSYDNFVEVMANYPNLSGFWIDNDNQYWIDHGLYDLIRQERPRFTLSNNNEDTPGFDTVDNEQKTGMTPAYDYPQGIWTPMPRLTEADFKLPTTGSWWYDGGTHPVDYGLSIGRLVTCAGASMKALMAETAQVNGRFPADQEAFNAFMSSYLDRIERSLRHTEGGGYMYGGLVPGAWNDGAYGCTTVARDDPERHYVHVVTPPSGGTLSVGDNGYRVRRVADARTGRPLAFRQSGGLLTISGVTTWDPYDTVFEVDTAGRHGIYPCGSVTATATAETADQPAKALVDGSYLTWWDNNGVLPVSVTLTLARPGRVAYLGINQREWSPVHPKNTTEASARIQHYQLSTSLDGTTWTSLPPAVLANARAARIIDVGAVARHVRLDITDTWATGTTTKYTGKLLVDQIWLGESYVESGR